MLNNKSVLLTMKLGRRFFRRTKIRLHFRSLSDSPILFANSFPKSGTHLLTQVLKGFVNLGSVVDSGLPAIVTYNGSSGQQRSLEKILIDIMRLKAGDIAYGHLHALPEIVTALTRDSIVPYFIYRDPRDVIVSHVFYVTEIEKNHVHHAYYSSVLETFDERLMTSILGLPDSQVPFPDISARFEPYLGWLNIPEVLSLRYEDFLNDREAVLFRIITHATSGGFRLQVPLNRASELLNQAIDPSKSPTFRSGKTGKWKDYFKEEHTDSFKEICGDLLIRLGYEEDNNW